jgi:hypothetical protein
MGDAPEHVGEHATFPRGKRCEKGAFDLLDGRAGLGEAHAALIGQMHGVGAAVGRIRLSLDEMLALEFIDQMDHGRLVCVHDLDQPLLTQIAAIEEQAEHGDVRDVEP